MIHQWKQNQLIFADKPSLWSMLRQYQTLAYILLLYWGGSNSWNPCSVLWRMSRSLHIKRKGKFVFLDNQVCCFDLLPGQEAISVQCQTLVMFLWIFYATEPMPLILKWNKLSSWHWLERKSWRVLAIFFAKSFALASRSNRKTQVIPALGEGL